MNTEPAVPVKTWGDQLAAVCSGASPITKPVAGSFELSAAEAQRTEAVRVADADDAMLIAQHERECAQQRRQHPQQCCSSDSRVGLCRLEPDLTGQQLRDEIAVAGDVPGNMPASSASSAVFTRLPLWPRANSMCVVLR